jgi:1,4-alpha-glucan branching enzyme
MRPYPLLLREDTLALGDVAAHDVHLDPERALLLHRRRGEVERFELHAPGAKSVTLGGSFARRRFGAVAVSGVWRVELPLLEGRYTFDWRVDGVARPGDEPLGRVVRPAVPLPEAWPR